MNLSELRLTGYFNSVPTSSPRTDEVRTAAATSSSPADIAWAYRDFEQYGSLLNGFTGVFQVETFAKFGDTVDIHLQFVPRTEFI